MGRRRLSGAALSRRQLLVCPLALGRRGLDSPCSCAVSCMWLGLSVRLGCSKLLNEPPQAAFAGVQNHRRFTSASTATTSGWPRSAFSSDPSAALSRLLCDGYLHSITHLTTAAYPTGDLLGQRKQWKKEAVKLVSHQKHQCKYSSMDKLARRKNQHPTLA